MDESTNLQSYFEQSNNVIAFPSSAITVIRDVNPAAREIVQRAYVDEVTEAYATMLANKFGQQGFDIFHPDFDKHFGFSVEAIRSTLLRSMNLDHPFQEIVEHAVELLQKES